MLKTKQQTVFLGMSGGVDSSVSALLLKNAGYNVVGVFIKVWQPEGFVCTSKEDRLDAMRVAAQLDIPFLTLDLEDEYKKGVIDYMLSEYRKGNTPNPDVMCNKEVKFGAFLNFALTHGADYIATGHYAQIREEGSVHELIVSADKEKDQTYFLWTLHQDQLKHVLFPIGHLEKQEVREIANKNNLYTAPKKDSQGLCFIGNVSFKDLLKSELHPEEGVVLDQDGRVIGVHGGAILYTIGERHGFTINKKTPNDEALFVIAKDIEKNTITVSTIKPELSEKTEILLHSVNKVSGNLSQTDVLVRFRYRQKLVKAKIIEEGSDLKVVLEEKSSAVSGQSAVIYDKTGKKLLAGGIID